MSTIDSPDLTSYTFRRGAKPMSIAKWFTLAAAGAICAGATLGLAVFESSGTASAAPAAAIVASGSSASLDARVFGIASPAESGPGPIEGFAVPARCAWIGDAEPQPGQDGGIYGPFVPNDGCGGHAGVPIPPPPPGRGTGHGTHTNA